MDVFRIFAIASTYIRIYISYSMEERKFKFSIITFDVFELYAQSLWVCAFCGGWMVHNIKEVLSTHCAAQCLLF